jgi:hypothetical protein
MRSGDPFIAAYEKAGQIIQLVHAKR